jgi:16S rRNA processing protein RimM
VAAYGDLYDGDGARRFGARCRGMVKGAVVAKLDGVDDRDAAERLRGLRLHVPRDRLPPPDDGEYYHADLIGLRAELLGEDGGPAKPLGMVSAVEDFGAGPVLEIAVEGRPPVMVPFTREVVPVVDLAGSRVGIAAVPGLLGEAPERASPRRDG